MTFRVVRPKIIVIALIFFSLSLPIPVFSLLYIDAWYFTLLLMVMFYGAYGIILHTYVVRRIKITESGLEYHALFTFKKWSWNEILFIGVGWYPIRRAGVPLWIYFTKDCDPEGYFANSSAFLRVHYRKAIIAEIQKYWTREIAGLQQVDEWLKK